MEAAFIHRWCSWNFVVLTVCGKAAQSLRTCPQRTRSAVRSGDHPPCEDTLGGVSDFYFEPGFAAFLVDRSDATLNLAVVEENSLTRPGISKDFRQ